MLDKRTGIHSDEFDNAQYSLEHHPRRYAIYTNVDRVGIRGVFLGQLEVHRSFPRLARDLVLLEEI
jgi:hypothetical protein